MYVLALSWQRARWPAQDDQLVLRPQLRSKPFAGPSLPSFAFFAARADAFRTGNWAWP